MGASGSSPATPIVVESGIADPHFDQKTSGVRITTAATEEKVDTHVNFKAAYDKGHEDGVNTFQSSLELVAAQVYDGVHKQLADIQTDSLKRSKQLVCGILFSFPFVCNIVATNIMTVCFFERIHIIHISPPLFLFFLYRPRMCKRSSPCPAASASLRNPVRMNRVFCSPVSRTA